jgi:sulfate/thiosulfate transport system ATP-binding protein
MVRSLPWKEGESFMSIQVEGIYKTYGTTAALQEINLEIPSGQLCALLGPSGSGKTTLLRVIAGLERADRGRIFFDGKDATFLGVRERRVGFVFQHYALFRHLTVFENIAFGLRVLPRRQRPSETAIRQKVQELLELVQLQGLEHRYPDQLSGGQKQRVALARALAIEPKVLMLDEPFGALDAKVRQELRQWLRQLHDRLHITSIFVTHDQEEALEIADRIVVMNHGILEQTGTPEQVYQHPANPFVLRFLGDVNQWPTNDPAHPGVWFVRPHEIDITRTPVSSSSIRATVRQIVHRGAICRMEAVHGESLIRVEVAEGQESVSPLQVGDSIFLTPRVIRVQNESGQLFTLRVNEGKAAHVLSLSSTGF